jgi:DNA-binding MarR family transcriptional regulator
MTAPGRRDEALRNLEHEIGMLLRKVRKGIGERAIAIHPDLNPTSYSLLLTLVDFGPRRAADLADMFALDKGAVSRVVRQLLDLGFVERTPDPNDGRASILAAAPAAISRFEEAATDRRRKFGERLSDWEPTDIDVLADGLARFNATISG